jgi:hypothetical protein
MSTKDPNPVDTYLLTYESNDHIWLGVESLKQELGRRGPDLIPTLIERGSICLASLGRNLMNPLLLVLTQRQLVVFGFRALGLTADLASSTRDGGTRVALRLLEGLESRDSIGKRAWASYLFSAKGVKDRDRRVVEAFGRHFEYDAPIVRVCCAMVLAQDGTPTNRQQRAAARERIEEFVRQEEQIAHLYVGKAQGDELQYYCSALVRYVPTVLAQVLAHETQQNA